MALDPTARRANVKDSIKKWGVDNFETVESLIISFDTSMRIPNLRGTPSSVTRWVGIDLGSFSPEAWTEFYLTFYCCTRKDNEGFRLAQLRDTIVGYLSDTTRTDGFARIPFYRSFENQAWVLLGSMLILSVAESEEMKAPDETKYIMLTCRIGFASKF